ncbi:MAG: hypothetical protein AB7H97_12000 [Pseudobdellovibrionaceae bacterium]
MAKIAMMYRIMAFMLWPKQGEKAKREAAERKLRATHMAILERKYTRKAAPSSEWSLQERARPEYQSALIRGLKEPWFPELILSEADSVARYVTASLVAYFALAVNPHAINHLGRDGAVNVACAIVNEFGGLSRDPKPVLIHQHAQAAMVDWGKNKRAAHFWAAYLVMKMDAPEREPIIDDFRQFVGIARHFRQVLDAALLRSVDLLSLPKGFRYPRIERKIELDQELIALLPFYKGDGDLGPRFEKPELTYQMAPK